MTKARADHEPVISPQTNVALLMMSAGAINRPLSGEVAHRPERGAMITGIRLGDILSPGVIARLMTGEQGAMKNIPGTAAVYLLVTQVSEERTDEFGELAELVRRSRRVSGVLYSEQPGNWSGTA